MRLRLRLYLTLALAASLTGCASLLPTGSNNTPSTFDSFEQAREALQKVQPFHTRLSELKQLGFDPEQGANVTLIPYPDIIGRLAPHPGVPLQSLDPGIRQCIEVQSDCRAFLFRFERQDNHREGGFWADFFNVQRITRISGWSFEALIVVGDSTVLFRNYAGQAKVDRVERHTNPLGPFQPAGESVGGVLLK